jgi:hypothetical protein
VCVGWWFLLSWCLRVGFFRSPSHGPLSVLVFGVVVAVWFNSALCVSLRQRGGGQVASVCGCWFGGGCDSLRSTCWSVLSTLVCVLQVLRAWGWLQPEASRGALYRIYVSGGRCNVVGCSVVGALCVCVCGVRSACWWWSVQGLLVGGGPFCVLVVVRAGVVGWWWSGQRLVSSGGEGGVVATGAFAQGPVQYLCFGRSLQCCGRVVCVVCVCVCSSAVCVLVVERAGVGGWWLYFS